MRSTTFVAFVLVATIQWQATAATLPSISIDGQKIQQTAIKDERGHIYVPIRSVLETFQTVVTYTPPRIVVVRKDGKILAGLIVNQRSAILAGQTHQFPAAPIRQKGRIYVPLRTIAEIIGANVIYIRQPPQVDIRLPDTHFLTTESVPEIQPVQTNWAPPWWQWAITGILILGFVLESYRRLMGSNVTRHTP